MDFYTELAKIVFDTPAPTSDQRESTKRRVFRYVYGGKIEYQEAFIDAIGELIKCQIEHPMPNSS